jgi:hypothetical protein
MTLLSLATRLLHAPRATSFSAFFMHLGLAADVARDGVPDVAVPVNRCLEFVQLGLAPRLSLSLATRLLHAPRGDLALDLVSALICGPAADVARDGDPDAAVPVNCLHELEELGLAP